MEMTHRQFNRVDLLALNGRLDAATAPQLREAIEELFRTGRYRIVLDMQQLEHISSAGLRVLTDARKRAREWKITDLEGGDIRLANVPRRIQEVLNLTGMTTLFALYDDTTAAVGSF